MNTQLLHISGEIIVILTVVFYLQRQITKVSKSFAELNKKMEEIELQNNKKFDALFEMMEIHLNQQSFMNRMPTPQMFNQQHQYQNQPVPTDNQGLRNRKTRQNFSNPQPQQDLQASEPMQLKKKPEQTTTQVPQQNKQPNMSFNNPLLTINPLDILSSLSNIAAPPVFSATIVTDNFMPSNSKQSEVNIVEVEDVDNQDTEEDMEKIDQEIAEDLDTLLNENQEQNDK